MNPLLVLVIAAQIGMPKALTCPDGCSCYLPPSDPPKVAFCDFALPISTRRIEPLMVEPERPFNRIGDVAPTDPAQTGSIRLAKRSEMMIRVDGKDELFDVPAVIKHDWQQWLGDQLNDPHAEWKVEDHWGYMRWWTCEDKRRVLMQAENGTRHCVLFEGAR